MDFQPQTTFKMFERTEVPEDELIISRTDLKGVITYANETFAQISGYRVDELVGEPHSILRHPDMPKSAFEDMWKTIRSGKMWKGYVKNLRKDSGYYWVYAEVSSVIKEGRVVEYKSMRSRVDIVKEQELQEQYDRVRETQEGIYRVVAYVGKEQLKTLAGE